MNEAAPTLTEIGSTGAPADASAFHAWNPGLEPGLPRAMRPFATLFRPENVALSYPEILELSDLSGLPATQIAPFRPERLAVHEVLIRVMADISVPVGEVYADLGLNFRRIVTTLLREGVAQRLDAVAATYEAVRAEADAILDRELAALLDEPPAPVPEPASGWGRWLARLGARDPHSSRSAPPAGDGQATVLARLDARCAAADEADTLESSVREALRTVFDHVIARQGMLIRDRALLRRLAGILVTNRCGSNRIGALIAPWIEAVVEAEGYHRPAPQAQPVVMTVKGASASGKSTIRPYQRGLAERIGASWQDFAVITPDVWRKFLLDYDSLGAVRRYAGPLTGHEVEIVDAKLDRYITRKAADGRLSHLLIDRFRFDSFSTEAGSDGAGQLLTRFGHRVFLQFMVTPPEETVERAWKRGEEFGRYKAVEDLLAHNVEAYTGMPRLFFNWVLRRDRPVFFEFLDNSVPNGARPLTIAFGTNDTMTILDARALLAIERYRRIDIRARSAADVYRGANKAPEADAGFLREVLRRLAVVRFADRETGRVFARFEQGRLLGLDRAGLAAALSEAGTAQALSAVGLRERTDEVPPLDESLSPSETSTLGAWGRELVQTTR
ncbi:zeta toxin family protein [Methylorubrum aminovorans]